MPQRYGEARGTGPGADSCLPSCGGRACLFLPWCLLQAMVTGQLPGTSPGHLVTGAGEMVQRRKALAIKSDNFGARRGGGKK